MKGIISFDKMIMPLFIKILFWLGVIGAILTGIVMIFMGFTKSGNVVSAMMGLGVLLFGPIIARLYAEMLIVVFKMQESLIQIRNAVRENNSNNNQGNNFTQQPSQPQYRQQPEQAQALSDEDLLQMDFTKKPE